MCYPQIELTLPKWVVKEVESRGKTFRSIDERMELVIALSKRNIVEGTGGPFAAAVFELDSGKLVAPGVNIVVQSNCSVAHAEAMALMTAQKVYGNYNLAAKELPATELVSSAQPCIQCFGNVWWSGVQRLVVGASGEDVEQITGFSEGPLPENWAVLLASRNLPLKPVQVIQHVLSDKACEVLQFYKDAGGVIYNAD